MTRSASSFSPKAGPLFEELTLAGGLKELKMQVPDAWPNSFRQSRFLSAVDFVQADRFRRSVAQEMARIFLLWICFWFRRCGMKYSPSPTSPVIRL
jgi:hypothetical protein